MQSSWQVLKAGMREKDVAAIICQSFENQDAKAKLYYRSFEERGLSTPSNRQNDPEKNHVIVIDIGGTMEGYLSDITRMAVISKLP